MIRSHTRRRLLPVVLFVVLLAVGCDTCAEVLDEQTGRRRHPRRRRRTSRRHARAHPDVETGRVTGLNHSCGSSHGACELMRIAC